MSHPSRSFLPNNRRRFLTGTAFVRPRPFVLAIAVLGVCAISPQAHAEISAPAAISDIYSDVNMHVYLATAKSVSALCADDECTPNREFDQQVQGLGARLSEAAFDTYPDLNKRIKQFEFVVAEKEELGSTSNAAGKIVVFRGVQELHFDEQALAFVMAREMGHIIGGHHDENTGTSILISVLVGVLFPVSNIFNALQGSAAVANATSSTFATTAASSATSYAGSQALLASVKPDQLREADAIAVKLLAGLGWSGRDTADILEACTQVNGDSVWAKDFRISVGYATALKEQVAIASNNPEVEPSDFLVTQNIDQQANAGVLSEMGLNTQPVLDTDKGNRSEGNTHFVGAEIVAKNDAGVSSDAVTADTLTVPEAKIEEQEVPIEDEANNTLTEEPQLSDATSHQVAKLGTQGASEKKITQRAGMNRNASRTASKKTSKVASRNAKPKLAKAAVSGKQDAPRKTYASKSSKTKLATNTAHKSKETIASNRAKYVSVKSRLDKIAQVKTAQVKIE